MWHDICTLKKMQKLEKKIATSEERIRRPRLLILGKQTTLLCDGKALKQSPERRAWCSEKAQEAKVPQRAIEYEHRLQFHQSCLAIFSE